MVDHLGMSCVMIGSSVQGRDLDDPGLDPFWAAAQGLGALVFLHPTSVAKHTPGLKERLIPYHLINCIGNPLETSIATAKLIFGGVLDRFPDLKLCLAHAGGYTPWIKGRWRRTHEVRKETKVARRDQAAGALPGEALLRLDHPRRGGARRGWSRPSGRST